MGDPNNVPTTGLLTATHYIKDNRLLPRGFDKATADNDIGVYGAAMQDPDFAGGGDAVHYAVPVAAAGGPFAGRSGAAVSADWLPLGAQPGKIRRARAKAVRRTISTRCRRHRGWWSRRQRRRNHRFQAAAFGA